MDILLIPSLVARPARVLAPQEGHSSVMWDFCFSLFRFFVYFFKTCIVINTPHKILFQTTACGPNEHCEIQPPATCPPGQTCHPSAVCVASESHQKRTKKHALCHQTTSLHLFGNRIPRILDDQERVSGLERKGFEVWSYMYLGWPGLWFGLQSLMEMTINLW